MFCAHHELMLVLIHSFVLFDIFRWENMEINVRTVDSNWTLKSSQSIDLVIVHSIRFCTRMLRCCWCYFFLFCTTQNISSMHCIHCTVHRAWSHSYKQITFQLIRMLFGFANEWCCGLRLWFAHKNLFCCKKYSLWQRYNYQTPLYALVHRNISKICHFFCCWSCFLPYS